MHSHTNARLTQRGRLRLVIQHLEGGRSLSELAAENGISLRCAYCWLARYRSGGVDSLRIDGVFAALSGGRSILHVSSTLSSSGTSACTCVTSPGCSTHPSRLSPGPSAAWAWAVSGIWNPNHRSSGTNGRGLET